MGLKSSRLTHNNLRALPNNCGQEPDNKNYSSCNTHRSTLSHNSHNKAHIIKQTKNGETCLKGSSRDLSPSFHHYIDYVTQHIMNLEDNNILLVIVQITSPLENTIHEYWIQYKSVFILIHYPKPNSIPKSVLIFFYNFDYETSIIPKMIVTWYL